jgi:hypothetical protein
MRGAVIRHSQTKNENKTYENNNELSCYAHRSKRKNTTKQDLHTIARRKERRYHFKVVLYRRNLTTPRVLTTQSRRQGELTRKELRGSRSFLFSILG